MGDKKLYLVVKQDTVLQATGYFVFAKDQEDAKDQVAQGYYIEETATTTLDTLETETKDVTEINQAEFGGLINEGIRNQRTSSGLHAVRTGRKRT